MSAPWRKRLTLFANFHNPHLSSSSPLPRTCQLVSSVCSGLCTYPATTPLTAGQILPGKSAPYLEPGSSDHPSQGCPGRCYPAGSPSSRGLNLPNHRCLRQCCSFERVLLAVYVVTRHYRHPVPEGILECGSGRLVPLGDGMLFRLVTGRPSTSPEWLKQTRGIKVAGCPGFLAPVACGGCMPSCCATWGHHDPTCRSHFVRLCSTPCISCHTRHLCHTTPCDSSLHVAMY